VLSRSVSSGHLVDRFGSGTDPVTTAQAYNTFVRQFQHTNLVQVQSLVKLARKAQQKAQAATTTTPRTANP